MRILTIIMLLLTAPVLAGEVPSVPDFNMPQKPTFDIPGSQGNRQRWRDKQAKEQADKQYKGKTSGRQLRQASPGRRGKVKTQWETLYSVSDGKVKHNKLALSEQFRAIAEVRVPKSDTERKNQQKELEWFASQGFDTVLVVWRGEGVISVKNLINSLKGDWNIIFAYGPHSHYGTAYINTNVVQYLMSLVAEDIDALLPVWRLTSNPHYGRLDEAGQYVDVFAQLAQGVNPDLPVFGEVYMQTKPITATPDGVTGAVLQNAGTIRAMEDVMLERAEKKAENIIPAIVGADYEYDKSNYSQQELWNMKTTCADNYINAGARGVIIFAGNGTGSEKNNLPALTQTEWRK